MKIRDIQQGDKEGIQLSPSNGEITTDMSQNPWNHTQLACEKIYRRRDKNGTKCLHEQLKLVNKHGIF